MNDVMLENMSCERAASPAFLELFRHVIEGNQRGINEVSPICHAILNMTPGQLTEAQQVATPLNAGIEPSRSAGGRLV